MKQERDGVCLYFDFAVLLNVQDVGTVTPISGTHNASIFAECVNRPALFKMNLDRLEVELIDKLNHGPILRGRNGLWSIGLLDLRSLLIRGGLRIPLVFASAVASDEVN